MMFELSDQELEQVAGGATSAAANAEGGSASSNGGATQVANTPGVAIVPVTTTLTVDPASLIVSYSTINQ
ncbi:hypothetical protein EPA93_08640 [Ktedonosporobacter rubrisoli]|uniref:Bacteriocin n=1 Tax=Ktedonosporobacter rubrisoli TaxID=2509675 RepID=A0A4P6JLH5_KTERU|nr:hypothetical protein [Ktedonosporobacter rubrisoli]QBD76069.1 hypothetical protein EPA93_08640 [Ktedonosporobacter rubrisoli]